MDEYRINVNGSMTTENLTVSSFKWDIESVRAIKESYTRNKRDFSNILTRCWLTIHDCPVLVRARDNQYLLLKPIADNCFHRRRIANICESVNSDNMSSFFNLSPPSFFVRRTSFGLCHHPVSLNLPIVHKGRCCSSSDTRNGNTDCDC